MKTALKWIAWGVAATIVVVVTSEVEPITRLGLALFFGLGWIVHSFDAAMQRQHQRQMEAIARVEQKVDQWIARRDADDMDFDDLPIGGRQGSV